MSRLSLHYLVAFGCLQAESGRSANPNTVEQMQDTLDHLRTLTDPYDTADGGDEEDIGISKPLAPVAPKPKPAVSKIKAASAVPKRLERAPSTFNASPARSTRSTRSTQSIMSHVEVRSPADVIAEFKAAKKAKARASVDASKASKAGKSSSAYCIFSTDHLII